MPKKFFNEIDTREAQYFRRLRLKCSRTLTEEQIADAWRTAMKNSESNEDSVFINAAR